MFGIGFWEFVLITVLVLLVLGPEKIGPIMKALGKAMREVQRGAFQIKQELKIDDDLDRVNEIKNSLARDVAADEEEVERTSTKDGARGAVKGEEGGGAGGGRWNRLHDDDVEVTVGTGADGSGKGDEQ